MDSRIFNHFSDSGGQVIKMSYWSKTFPNTKVDKPRFFEILIFLNNLKLIHTYRELWFVLRMYCSVAVGACWTRHWAWTPMNSRVRVVARMRRLLNMSTIRCEIKVLRIILEVVLLKEMSQLLSRGKFDSTWTVDVDIPSPRLLPMLPLLQLPHPPMGQSVVTEFKNFGQVGRSSSYLNIAVWRRVSAAGESKWSTWQRSRAVQTRVTRHRSHGVKTTRRQRHLLRHGVVVSNIAGGVEVGGVGITGGGDWCCRVTDVDAGSPGVIIQSLWCVIGSHDAVAELFLQQSESHGVALLMTE